MKLLGRLWRLWQTDAYEDYKRPNFEARTHEQLVKDCNDLWAQFRLEQRRRLIDTAVTVALLQILAEVLKIWLMGLR